MDGYVLCHTEKVWHPYVMRRPDRSGPPDSAAGTHGGTQGERPRQRLDGEARARRLAKNARNAGRSGEATRPPGAQKVVSTRLFKHGNRLKRIGS